MTPAPRHCLGSMLAIMAGNTLAAPLTAGNRDHSSAARARIPGIAIIAAGHVTLGSTAAETAREDMPARHAAAEQPAHEVAVRSFGLSRQAVTNGAFARFVAATGYRAVGCTVADGHGFRHDPAADWRAPGFAQTPDQPVVCVSWDDAQAYVRWIAGVTGRPYRLPSEAEWEYAARAGRPGARYWHGGARAQCRYANGADASYARRFPAATAINAACADGYAFTAPVGSLRPNAFGLFDMLGNAWQWQADCWNDSYAGAPADARARTDGDCGKHAVRGGSWTNDPRALRAAARVGFAAGARDNDVGFRLALTLAD